MIPKKQMAARFFARWLILPGCGLLMLAASFAVQAQPPTPQSLITPTAASLPFRAGTLRLDSKGVLQAYVPAGCFLMGSTQEQIDAMQNQAVEDGLSVSLWHELVASEQPAHEVCLTHGFWIDAFEVTFEKYREFIAAGGYNQQSNWSAEGWPCIQKNGILGPFWLHTDSPEWRQNMEASAGALVAQYGLSWYEAWAYAHWRGCRLPSEAEWEYAARGPQSLIYPWGNTFDASKFPQDNPLWPGMVGRVPANKSWAGAFDMGGNVCEWVNDWYAATYYRLKIKDDPPGPESGTYRVVKGCINRTAPQMTIRAALRNYAEPYLIYGDLGFRVACEAASLDGTGGRSDN